MVVIKSGWNVPEMPHLIKKTGPISESVNWWQFFVNVSQGRNLIKVLFQPRLVDVKKMYATLVGISVIWLKDKGVLIVIG